MCASVIPSSLFSPPCFLVLSSVSSYKNKQTYVYSLLFFLLSHTDGSVPCAAGRHCLPRILLRRRRQFHFHFIRTAAAQLWRACTRSPESRICAPVGLAWSGAGPMARGAVWGCTCSPGCSTHRVKTLDLGVRPWDLGFHRPAFALLVAGHRVCLAFAHVSGELRPLWPPARLSP